MTVTEYLHALQPIEPMDLGERILELLDEGAFSSSYKYALLLALVELCIETSESTAPVSIELTTRALAEKVIEYYWLHTLPFDEGVLRQNNRGQAEILKLILEFRAYHVTNHSETPSNCRREKPQEWSRLVSSVEWKLIEMPLPRLQTIGNRTEPFLYQLTWDHNISRRSVRSYQLGQKTGFNGRILLLPGVAQGLVRLSPLLKPMIRNKWTSLVARFNRLEVSRLEDFLFGEDRIPLTGARDFLANLQGEKCFYCSRDLDSRGQVDHFIPWSRYQNNAVENLVLAHAKCNNNKRDFLAYSEHVRAWHARMKPSSHISLQMMDFARENSWEYRPDISLSVASTIYRQLPEGYSLWQGIDLFVPFKADDFTLILREDADT